MSVFNHQLKNSIHTLVIFLCMGVILSLVGFIIAGVEGILWSVFLCLLILVISPKLSPSFIFSLYKGELLTEENAPGLIHLTQELAARANLSALPAVYYLPSRIMNAFSVGSSTHSAIGLSDALLNTLSTREIIAVLAHEISHIQHNDVRLMTYADNISRVINIMSLTGFLLIFISLPLFALGMVRFSLLAVAILILAPNIMNYLQLSLSRMREFDADHQAALLTGDPDGLASALRKLEFHESSLFDLIFGRQHNASIPSILRTHPDTEERIERLNQLKVPSHTDFNYSRPDTFAIPGHFQKMIRKPRWHVGGFWY